MTRSSSPRGKVPQVHYPQPRPMPIAGVPAQADRCLHGNSPARDCGACNPTRYPGPVRGRTTWDNEL